VFYGFVFCISLLFIGNIIMLLGIVVASMMEFSFWQPAYCFHMTFTRIVLMANKLCLSVY